MGSTRYQVPCHGDIPGVMLVHQVPPEHLEPCHTCDATGRSYKKETKGGEGVSGVDFVLYVSAVTTPQCLEAVGGEAETVAYAAHCQQEESLDRPVAGHTNICPGAISNFVCGTLEYSRTSVCRRTVK